jgi:hypothetical protein
VTGLMALRCQPQHAKTTKMTGKTGPRRLACPQSGDVEWAPHRGRYLDSGGGLLSLGHDAEPLRGRGGASRFAKLGQNR